MKVQMFAVYDSVGKQHMSPFFMNLTNEATRQFKNVVNDQESRIYLNPTDYSLFKIGTFDNTTGEFEPELTKIMTGEEAIQETLPFEEEISDLFNTQAN